jgi:hypothetical protein
MLALEAHLLHGVSSTWSACAVEHCNQSNQNSFVITNSHLKAATEWP